jgi:hypothetical protein
LINFLTGLRLFFFFTITLDSNKERGKIKKGAQTDKQQQKAKMPAAGATHALRLFCTLVDIYSTK